MREEEPSMSTESGIEELKRLREEARLGGGAKRIEAQHARGKLTARERLALLLDESTFQEIDPFITHRTTDFGMTEEKYGRENLTSFQTCAMLTLARGEEGGSAATLPINFVSTDSVLLSVWPLTVAHYCSLSE